MDDTRIPSDQAEPAASDSETPEVEEDETPIIHTIQVDKPRIIELLEKGIIEGDYGRLRWSSNYTTVVTVKDEELETLAIYKPCRGERPLWDFPENTLYKREIAAYVVSESLSWEIVAPTVSRDGPLGIGSLQLFIQHDPQISYFDLDESFFPQLRHIAAFDYLTNNADRKGGHCLLDPRGKLWGIDHGICFNAQFKLRTVIWNFAGDPIPEAMLKDIECFYRDVNNAETIIHRDLYKLLLPNEVEALQKRARHLLRTRCFPQPGPGGPNYPWPPI